MKINLSFIYLTIAIVLSGCTNQEKSTSLLHSDFENNSDENLSPWQEIVSPRVFSSESGITTDAHSGEKAYSISRIWTENKAPAGIETSSPLPIESPGKYLLSFWYKTENLIEYSLPITIRFNVMRSNHKSLNYQKNISWSDAQWRQCFFLLENLPEDADSVQIQIYTRFRTKGSIVLDDIEFSVASKKDIDGYEIWRRQDIPDPLGNADLMERENTGFFKMKKGEHRWWITMPDGSPTWSMGTMAVKPISTRNGNIEVCNWFDENYKKDTIAYVNMLFDTLKSWGFNSYAGWTSDEFAQITAQRHQNNEEYFPMYHVLSLCRMGENVDYYARNNKGDLKDGSHGMVDPYNPQWREEARQKAMAQIPAYKDKSWFAGWYIDNEINLVDLFNFIWGDYSSKEFVKSLKNKYQSIGQLNQSWSSSFGQYNYGSFDEILTDKPEPKDWDDPLYEDFTDFERTMVKEYIDFTYDLVKELDPNHIIISNRINLGNMGDIYRTIDLWAKYDLICMNIYPQNLLFGFSPGELEIMNRLHEGTGKPVIIGEWSVPAIGPKLYGFGVDPYDRPVDWSWPQVVRTQKERGEVYQACMLQLASMDFIVGAGWYRPIDVNSPTRRANRGLIDGDFEPYGEMVNTIKETHGIIEEKMNL
ncbi:MAG: beta-galactosidase [Bacteroidales bacterium]|nr:beta-galactosidase [Bacteroidales bacterium]